MALIKHVIFTIEIDKEKMKLYEEYCWDVTPYSTVKIFRLFKEIYAPYSSLKIVVRLIRYLQISD